MCKCGCKDAYGKSPRADCPYCGGTDIIGGVMECCVPGCETPTSDGVCLECDVKIVIAARQKDTPHD